jgi:serine/threonine protein kinase
MHHQRAYTPPPAGSIPLGDERFVELGPLIGRGGVSYVHHGAIHHTESGIRRPVALKLFGTISTDDREVVESALLRSVRRSACILHPNVVGVHEFGVYEDCPFIISELVLGRSLRVLLDLLARTGRRLPLDLALFIGVELAEGLAGARRARDTRGNKLQIIHGELSPRDVLLSFGGEVKITDFELGGARHAASSIRSLKVIAHRAVSLAPEVACGVAADARSDVFSLGLVLREMLIGPRFTRAAKEADVVKLARDGAIDPVTFQPKLPGDLSQIIATALAIDPDQRYPHAGEMAYELRRAALSLGVSDVRVFLRRALRSEFAGELSSVTDPRTTPVPAAPIAPDASPEEGFRARWHSETDEG